MKSKLRHEAYGEIPAKEHKPMKTQIIEPTWYETVYVIKESYNMDKQDSYRKEKCICIK
jgi:hypothetical protein